MSKKPRQKVVLITGASTGIGRATAKLLASKGYQVYGAVRSPERVEPLPGVELVRVDVRDDASVAAGVDAVLRKAGRIDVLVNNAGYNLVGAVEETSIEQAQALFDTNVFGVLRMMRAVLPSMRRERSGLIINVSSVLGFLPAPFMGLYASSKHAVEGLSESLDHEVRGLGIRVTLVEPSFTNTPFESKFTARRRSDRGLFGAVRPNCGGTRRQAQAGSASGERRANDPPGDREQFPVATPGRDRGEAAERSSPLHASRHGRQKPS